MIILWLKEKFSMLSLFSRKYWFIYIVLFISIISIQNQFSQFFSQVHINILAIRISITIYALTKFTSLMPMIIISGPLVFMMRGSSKYRYFFYFKYIVTCLTITFGGFFILFFSNLLSFSNFICITLVLLNTVAFSWIKFNEKAIGYRGFLLMYILLLIVYLTGLASYSIGIGLTLFVWQLLYSFTQMKPELNHYLEIMQLSYESKIAAINWDLLRIQEIGIAIQCLKSKSSKETNIFNKIEPKHAILAKNLLTLYRTNIIEGSISIILITIGVLLSFSSLIIGAGFITWGYFNFIAVCKKPILQIFSKMEAGMNIPFAKKYIILQSVALPIILISLISTVVCFFLKTHILWYIITLFTLASTTFASFYSLITLNKSKVFSVLFDIIFSSVVFLLLFYSSM